MPPPHEVYVKRPGELYDPHQNPGQPVDPDSLYETQYHWTFRAEVDGQFGTITLYSESLIDEHIAAEQARAMLLADPSLLQGIASADIGLEPDGPHHPDILKTLPEVDEY